MLVNICIRDRQYMYVRLLTLVWVRQFFSRLLMSKFRQIQVIVFYLSYVLYPRWPFRRWRWQLVWILLNATRFWEDFQWIFSGCFSGRKVGQTVTVNWLKFTCDSTRYHNVFEIWPGVERVELFCIAHVSLRYHGHEDLNILPKCVHDVNAPRMVES